MIIWKNIKWAIIVYCLVGIAVYYLQNYMILRPDKLPPEYKFSFSEKFEEVSIPLNKEDTINLVKFFPAVIAPAQEKDSAQGTNINKGVVLYFHGNRQNVVRYEKFIAPFLKKGYEVWLPDYPGFGKSTGIFTEEKMYKLAFQVRQLAGTLYDSSKIIVYGKSLGSGTAAYLASTTANKMLILETPYYSMPDVFRKYLWMYPLDRMINFKFPTGAYLEAVKEPIFIFHGTDDGVISYKSSSKLKSKLKSGDQFFTLPGESHNTVNLSDIYYKTIDSLLEKK